MPPITYPNQRMVCVHRERATKDFLGIKNENWMAASRILGAHALRLYLYLAANADNYTLALSPAAIMRDVGIPRQTYHDQWKKLIAFGYVVPGQGNTFHFYEVPQAATRTENELPGNGQDFEESTADGQGQPQPVQNDTPKIIEINNNDLTDNCGINKETDSLKAEIFIPKVKEVTIPRPVAEGKNRPKPVEQPQKAVFDF